MQTDLSPEQVCEGPQTRKREEGPTGLSSITSVRIRRQVQEKPTGSSCPPLCQDEGRRVRTLTEGLLRAPP